MTSVNLKPEKMTTLYPTKRLSILVEPFFEDEEMIGFVCYFPIRGSMESKSSAFIEIEYIRAVLITDSVSNTYEEIIMQKSLNRFSTFFPVKYVVNKVEFDIRLVDPTPILSKFQFELHHLLPHIRHSLKIEKEKIHFCELESLPPLNTHLLQPVPITHLHDEPTEVIEKILQDEVKIAEAHEEVHILAPLAPPPPPKVKTIWDYHGFENNPPKPSPWEAFASHLESEEDGGYCRGQWDGHLNEKTIANGVPYGIVDTNGNRDKIQDILSCKLVTKENPLYQLFVDLLKAKNSHERVQLVKIYLEERDLKYNDESFWIKEEGKPPVKQTFFKAVILRLVHQTPQFQHYLKKKHSQSC